MKGVIGSFVHHVMGLPRLKEHFAHSLNDPTLVDDLEKKQSPRLFGENRPQLFGAV